MKKGTKKFLFFSVATIAGMYAYNQFVASTSTKKNMLPTKNGQTPGSEVPYGNCFRADRCG